MIIAVFILLSKIRVVFLMSKHNNEKRDLLVLLFTTVYEVTKNTIQIQNNMHESIQKQFDIQIKHRGIESDNRIHELFQQETKHIEKVDHILIKELDTYFQSHKQRIEHMSEEEIEKTNIDGKDGFVEKVQQTFNRIISEEYPKIVVKNRIDRILERIHQGS
jgi:hypothetical protein